MTARPTYLIFAASLALAPALLAQDHAVSRGGGGGDSSAESSHPSPGGGGESSVSSGSSGGWETNTTSGPSFEAAPVYAQDHAVPRGGGGGGSSGGGGSHPSPGVSSSGGGSQSSPGYSGGSSSGSGSSSSSTAERRHPRAGTGSGSGGGYYPGYPSYPGWGGGGYYPGYWGSWWPYGSYGWYGGGYGGYYGYPWGWGGGGTVYHQIERESGAVRVLVDPSEARVYVDGYYSGTVDDFDGLFQRLSISSGRHEIALKLEGYKTHRMKVYVAPDSTLKLHYELEKGQGESFEDLSKDAPESEARRGEEQEQRWAESEARAEKDEATAMGGRLELSIRPEDASVYVDGAFRGSAGEASTLRLAPGRHRIEIVRPGYKTLEKEVDVAPGQSTNVKVELDRPSN